MKASDVIYKVLMRTYVNKPGAADVLADEIAHELRRAGLLAKEPDEKRSQPIASVMDAIGKPLPPPPNPEAK